MSKPKEVAPDWAGIAASKDSELESLRSDLVRLEDEGNLAHKQVFELSVIVGRVVEALDSIEPECHRRDVKGVEVVTLVRRALEGGNS